MALAHLSSLDLLVGSYRRHAATDFLTCDHVSERISTRVASGTVSHKVLNISTTNQNSNASRKSSRHIQFTNSCSLFLPRLFHLPFSSMPSTPSPRKPVSCSSASTIQQSEVEPFQPWKWIPRMSAEGGEASSLSVSADAPSSTGSGPASEAQTGTVGRMHPIARPLSVEPLVSKMGASNFRVAYQGVPGAYSEEAAMKAYPVCEPVPCEQFDAAFQAVELWLVDRAVLPIENSLGGSIHRNFDLLMRHRLHIVGEVQLAVHHCLLAIPGTKAADLKRVLSHPQALAQCEMTLSQLGVTRENFHDTAGAAQMIASEVIRDAAAIASRRAAQLYGLDILADGIQDDADNVTRFLILAREPIMPHTDIPFKTSIVFTLEPGPGMLFKALSVFALREINLTKIESRPQKNKPLRVFSEDRTENGSMPEQYRVFDYLFYIDFQASMAEPRAQNALRHLQEFAPFLRVLGSYAMDVSPVAKL
eukprot:jgi/Mesen1/6836/ME000351S05952